MEASFLSPPNSAPAGDRGSLTAPRRKIQEALRRFSEVQQIPIADVHDEERLQLLSGRRSGTHGSTKDKDLHKAGSSAHREARKESSMTSAVTAKRLLEENTALKRRLALADALTQRQHEKIKLLTSQLERKPEGSDLTRDPKGMISQSGASSSKNSLEASARGSLLFPNSRSVNQDGGTARCVSFQETHGDSEKDGRREHPRGEREKKKEPQGQNAAADETGANSGASMAAVAAAASVETRALRRQLAEKDAEIKRLYELAAEKGIGSEKRRDEAPNDASHLQAIVGELQNSLRQQARRYRALLETKMDSVAKGVSIGLVNAEVKALFSHLKEQLHEEVARREAERCYYCDVVFELESRLQQRLNSPFEPSIPRS